MNIKTLISWLLKNILFPLLPTLIAGLLRAIQSTGNLPKDLFESSDVFFSMAMLCLLAYTDFQKISDKDTREILTQLFIGLLVLMLALFSNSIITNVDLDNIRIGLIKTLGDSIANQGLQNIILIEAQIDNHTVLSARDQVLALTSYIIAFVVVTITIFTKWKFDPWKTKNPS